MEYVTYQVSSLLENLRHLSDGLRRLYSYWTDTIICQRLMVYG